MDKLQETTIRELDFYNARQDELKKKLEEQQRVLQAVENDIKKREELLNYVFESRRTDEINRHAGVNMIEERSSDTSSLHISAITSSVLQSANQSQSEDTSIEKR